MKKVIVKKDNHLLTLLDEEDIQDKIDEQIDNIVAGDLDLTTYAKTNDLATVATTGSYNDLSNKPDIPQITIIYNENDVVNDGLYICVPSLTATVTSDSVSLGKNMIAAGDILIDWGDGTTTTRQSGDSINSQHTYTDGQSEHTIGFIGEITSLGDDCFWNCTGLTSINIPNTVTNLGNFCFLNCTNLTSIIVPNNITSFGEECFDTCRNLTSITIPNSVTNIGNNCFHYCNIVDYQLYWKDSAILEYNSYNMPAIADTYFTIPYGQTQNYINAGYPSNILQERGA